jgi:alpha-glucan,water dikinase
MGRFAVPSPMFTSEIVGGKSRNLQELRGRLPDWINLPASVALPFCTFDAVLASSDNAHVSRQLETLRVELGTLDFGDTGAFVGLLKRMRDAIAEMVPTPQLVGEMMESFAEERLPWPEGDLGPAARGGSGAGVHAWAAITGVWGSKYNERAVLSCRKAGIKHEDVSMAVLCQPVVQSQYAFVLHTTNPQTGDEGEIYGEVVCGMGEALVGNFAGRALSFVARKDDLSNPRVTGFPSKANGLFTDAPTLIFRSDSNGEDLEGFAGAGLYDSIQMDEATLRTVDYSADPLVHTRYHPTTLVPPSYHPRTTLVPPSYPSHPSTRRWQTSSLGRRRWRRSRTRRTRSSRRSGRRRTSRGASPQTGRCSSCRRARRCNAL